MIYRENSPQLWRHHLPVKGFDQHKYHHGHALVFAAPDLTGATNLAASACARIGAGLVTVIPPHERADLYRSVLPAHLMVQSMTAEQAEQAPKAVKGVTACLYGPGGGFFRPDLKTTIPTVLDAAALSDLPPQLSPNFILTPHEGEFSRAFPTLEGERREKVLNAAAQMNCHLILKGAETLIAAPDGQVIVNRHASPWLATAGSGDVLSGIITGLLAQGVPPLQAACAAVWIHGDASWDFGPLLVASDLIAQLPSVYSKLLQGGY